MTFAQRYPQSAWRDDAETRRLQLAARSAGGRDEQRSTTSPSPNAWAASTRPPRAPCPVPPGGRGSGGYTRAGAGRLRQVLAVQALARPGNDAAVDDLRRLALESASPAVRQASIGALARIGTARAGAALGELVGGLLERAAARDSVAAMAASEAIMQTARRGDNTLLPFVERYYRNANVPARLRWTLLTSTRQIATPEARAFQWRALQADALAPQERAEVAQWLAYGMTPDELTRLGTLMRSERDATVREGYARALRTLVNGAARWSSFNSYTTTGMAVSVGDTWSKDTALLPAPAEARSVELLAAVEGHLAPAPGTLAEARVAAEEQRRDREALVAQALDLAATQLRSEPEMRVQLMLVGALAAPGFDRGVEPLSAFAFNTGAHEDVRAEALDALGQIGTEAAFEALQNAVRRVETARVLRAGIQALVSSPAFRVRADAVPDLVRLTTNADIAVRRTAVDALGRLDAPQARQALLDLIRNASR